MKVDISEAHGMIRKRYSAFAQAAAGRAPACSPKAAPVGCCGGVEFVYSPDVLASVPALARTLSRGCGNPGSFAALRAGETVVDLGCGGGIDVILAARHVLPGGKVIGVDFSPHMIERAQLAVGEAGLASDAIEFRVAEIESTAIPNEWADAVISNCVINLCPDKAAVFAEAFRILKPTGRLAISDILLTAPLPGDLLSRFAETRPGCLGGCEVEALYWDILTQAGFDGIDVRSRHIFGPEELWEMACCPGSQYLTPPSRADVGRAQGMVESVKFTAVKRRSIAPDAAGERT